jgi:hypothetical protein
MSAFKSDCVRFGAWGCALSGLLSAACGPPIDPPDTPPDDPPSVPGDCSFGDAPPGTIRTLLSVDPGPSGQAPTPTLLALNDKYLYFAREFSVCGFGRCVANGSAYRMPRCGGVVEDLGPVLEPLPAPQGVVGVAVAGGYTYFLTSLALLRIREANKARSSIPLQFSCTSDVVANSTHVFVHDTCGHRILRAAHTDSVFSVFAETTADSWVGPLALAGGKLYFQRGIEIWSQGLDGSPATRFYDTQVTRLADTQQTLFSLAADERAVIAVVLAPYDQVDRSTRFAVRRIPVDGSAASELGVALRDGNNTDVAISSGQAYFTRSGPDNAIEVARTPTNATNVTTVLRRGPTHLAVYGERLYWSEEGSIFTALPQSTPAADPP